MEVCKNNMWGTVCHTGWDVVDSRVVCQQLGYSTIGELYLTSKHCSHTCYVCTGSTHLVSSFFGGGTGPITLNAVACTGIERRLIDCSSGAITSQCSHSHDAGVRCTPQTGNHDCLYAYTI